MLTLFHSRVCSALAALVVALGATVAFAQRELTDIPPVDPELERATFVVPEDFEVNLFAADPQIAKPIQINFDAQGRLWIASSSIYPQVQPGAPANDRILILEDADHDGVADRTTVFADGLLIPSAVVPGDGGAYVGASTDLLFFRDLDGDGRADEKHFVLSGFGTEDTHHTIHTLRWGPEQLLYFKQSIYIHSHLETPWGVKRLNAGGTWQMRPHSLELDVFDRGLVNSWGMAWNDFGATFATDGAGGEGINYIVPGASYFTAYGADRILSGLNPGSPKHCSLDIVAGPGLPADWQGSLITNDFRGHRVCRFTVREVGSGFLSQEQQEVIKSNHVAFRPVDVKQGPDGALYVADWYNPIIQHGEVDFRDPRRDHVHGRIWRVSWTGARALARPAAEHSRRLPDLPTEQLVAQLESDDRFLRQSAKRLLVERGAEDVLPLLRRWMVRLDNTAPTYHRSRLEALWLHLALDVPEWELAESLVHCSTPAARAAAVRVCSHWLSDGDAGFAERIDRAATRASVRRGAVRPAELFEIAVHDPHPRVRLEAVRGLARARDPRAVELAMEALDHDVDEFLDYALWLTARELQPLWQPALTAGVLDFHGNARHLAFACKSAGSQAAIPSLLGLLAAGRVGDADLPGVLDVVAEFGAPGDLQRLVELAAAEQDVARQAPILHALLLAARERQAIPPGPFDPLAGAPGSASAEIRALAARLIGAWKLEAAAVHLDDMIRDAEPEVVAAAVEGFADLGTPAAIARLQQLAASRPTAPPAIRGLLIHRPQEAATALVDRLTEMASSDRLSDADLTELLRNSLQRKEGPELLQTALQGRKLPPDAAKLAIRVASSTGQSQEALVAAFRTAGGLGDQPQKPSPEELASLLADVRAHGDAVRGEEVFRRDDLACFKCHAVGDAGGVVGPNLVSLGASAQPDYILESLVDPNAKIKENFHTLVVATDQGEVLSGVKVRETESDLILRDAEDRELRVPLKSIEEQKPGASLMPLGVVERLTRAELVDLTAFLAALGRLPEYTLAQQSVARRWDVLASTPQAHHVFHRNGLHEAANDNPAFQWTRAYSRVNGELPIEPLPDLRMLGQSRATRGLSFLRCELEAASAGGCTLGLNDSTGVRCWIDQQPVDLRPETPVELAAGARRLTLVIDHAARTAPVKLSVIDPGTSGARFVGGK